MRTYRLWYVYDVSYADEDEGDMADALAAGKEITAMINEHVELKKAELLIGGEEKE